MKIQKKREVDESIISLQKKGLYGSHLEEKLEHEQLILALYSSIWAIHILSLHNKWTTVCSTNMHYLMSAYLFPKVKYN